MARHEKRHEIDDILDHSVTNFVNDELVEVADPGGGSRLRSTGITTSSVSTAVAQTHVALTLDAGVVTQDSAALVGQQLQLVAVTPTTYGVMSPTDKAKLDGIEAGATADQIASEVPFTPVGAVSATDVQAAIAEVDSEHVAKAALPVSNNLYAMDSAGDGIDSGIGVTSGDAAINKAAILTPTLVAGDWVIEDLTASEYQFVYQSSSGPRSIRLTSSGFLSAVQTTYNPTTPSDWVVAPSNVGAGLDELASRLTALGPQSVIPLPFGRNHPLGGDQWLRMAPDGVPSNVAPVRIPFDFTIVGISASASSAPVGAEIEVHPGAVARSGGVPVNGTELAQLSLTALSADTFSLSVNGNAGDELAVYARNAVSNPSGYIWIVRR